MEFVGYNERLGEICDNVDKIYHYVWWLMENDTSSRIFPVIHEALFAFCREIELSKKISKIDALIHNYIFKKVAHNKLFRPNVFFFKFFKDSWKFYIKLKSSRFLSLLNN